MAGVDKKIGQCEMNIKEEVVKSAIKQECPANRVDDVWESVRTLELPQSQNQLDRDVFLAMREMGLA